MECKTCGKNGFYVSFHNMPPGTTYVEYVESMRSFECADCFNERLKVMTQMLEDLIKQEQNAFGVPHFTKEDET
jgi:hypothetical protein